MKRSPHDLEREIGLDYYVTDAGGVGGRLRDAPEDFRVREREAVDTHPVDADPGDYPYLVCRVTLDNWDTNDYARALSNALGVSRNRVSWAGTKDKRAVTTQLFGVRDVDPADLPGLPGADLEVVGRAGRALQFGDLAGNEFRVVVRDPDHPERVDDVTADLRTFAGSHPEESGEGTLVGVPNAFGPQRFGSVRPVTHEVGLAIVRGDWEDAVLAYVGHPSPEEPADTRDARSYVEKTRDWVGALDRFPERLRYERTILSELAAGADFRDALDALPWNLRRLFVHAAQSYAFNLMLGERLSRGLPFDRPVEGDVVCFAESVDGASIPDPDRTGVATASRVDVLARHCERGRAFVTAPLVGTDTVFGSGEPADVARSVLDDLDLRPADFDLPDPYDSTGTRRAVLVRTSLALERDPLAFSFSLPPGAYATTLLREYLQTSPLAL